MDEKVASSGLRHLSFRVIDSALLIAMVLAVLQYAGWTYRQTYLSYFSIDPSSLDSSGMSVAAEGLGAIINAVWAWATASVGLIITAIGTPFFIRWVEGRRGNDGPIADRTTIRMIQAGGTLLAVSIVLASGVIAGRRAATDQIVAVRQGHVWTYHLSQQTLSGVPVAQSKDLIWLLTKEGVRLIRTIDVRLVNGPRLAQITAEASS